MPPKEQVWFDEDEQGNLIAPDPLPTIDGHNVLMQCQAAILFALAQEHAAGASGGRLGRDSDAYTILRACTQIYGNAVGSQTHTEAAHTLLTFRD